MDDRPAGGSTTTLDAGQVTDFVRSVLEAAAEALTARRSKEGAWWVTVELDDGSLIRAAYGRL